MKKVRVFSEAKDDLREITTWYRDQSPAAAVRFYAEYRRILGNIQAGPRRYADRDTSFRRANLHRFPYYIVFREMKNSIEIIAIAHASRHPARWQRRMPAL